MAVAGATGIVCWDVCGVVVKGFRAGNSSFAIIRGKLSIGAEMPVINSTAHQRASHAGPVSSIATYFPTEIVAKQCGSGWRRNGGFSRGRNVIGMKYECLGGPLGSLCKLNHWLTDVVVVAG